MARAITAHHVTITHSKLDLSHNLSSVMEMGTWQPCEMLLHQTCCQVSTSMSFASLTCFSFLPSFHYLVSERGELVVQREAGAVCGPAAAVMLLAPPNLFEIAEK